MNNKLFLYGKIFRFFGMQWYARWFQSANNVRITYTHEITCKEFKNYERIIHYLQEIRTFISPEEFFYHLDQKRSFKGKFFLMTFDDGLISSYKIAKSVLNKYKIKAIFFIPTAVLDLTTEREMYCFAAENIHYGSRYDKPLTIDEYHFMNASHLEELALDGHMICPHTHNHVLLNNINDEMAAQRELINPKTILEKLLNKRVRAFAFPVGTEKQVGKLAYKIIYENYDFCFTALNGTNSSKTSPYHLHRDCIPNDASIDYVRIIMTGSYDLYYKIKMRHLVNKIGEINT